MGKIIRQGIGPGGFCICPKCGYKKIHEAGIPCREEKCPNCGTKMMVFFHHTHLPALREPYLSRAV